MKKTLIISGIILVVVITIYSIPYPKVLTDCEQGVKDWMQEWGTSYE